MPSRTFIKTIFFAACSFCLMAAHAEEVETLELSTGDIHPLKTQIGHASLIQLPVEPTATNVGDSAMWLVEKADRTVSIKPIQVNARDTSLAILTRQGTINFSIHLVGDSEPFTQMVRVTGIRDDSKPLPPTSKDSPETLADIVVREIRTAQNYHALKQVNSREIQNVEQITQLREIRRANHSCTLLQTFRFRDTRHLVLHFTIENMGPDSLSLDQRRTTVIVAETLLAPMAVSFGKNVVPPKKVTENFILLEGSNGLSPKNEFEIHLAEKPVATQP